ncbi:MAG: MMPL family transporter [Solirubrobacterales bacterium]|nr:MMPL family transporter [Solirubrobacterales bacterium]
MLARIADITWRRPKLVLGLVGLVAVLAIAFGRDVEHHLKAAGFTDSSSESERATALLGERLGFDPNPAIALVVTDPDGGRLDVRAPEVRSEVARLAAGAAEVEHVGRVVNPLEDRRAGAALIAEDGRSLVVTAHLDTVDVEDAGGVAAEGVQPIAAASDLDVAVGGFAPGFNETNDQTRADLLTSELIAFPILALLLLVVFRGVVAAAIPLAIGVLSIVGTLLVLRVMAGFVDTSLFALNIATGLSLGLAVDYALLMVSRYREELARHGPTIEAHRNTVLTAGRTAVFSGFTVAAALAALIVMPQRFLYSMAVAGAAVGILSAVIAILVVPSLLSLLGTRIDALSIRRGRGAAATTDGSGGWYRLARGVMRRPVAAALASTAIMLAAASPLLWTTLTGPSSEAVPPGQPSYDAKEYLEAHYPRDVVEAVTVVVSGEAGARELAAFQRRVEVVDGVVRMAPFARADGGDLAYANLALAGPALEGAAQDAVAAIRALEPPGAATTLVSGNTARFIDQKESLLAHAPLVVALVAAATLILLFMLTGSVLLPLKTLLMNVLTLGATLGILVLAFQDGLLHGVLGYSGPSAVETTSLVFLFAVIFGLATDYAVLVMARIKEHHDAGLDNEEAVALGIAKTGRVITVAALAIAVVFLAFAVSSVFFVKQIAIGMAFGVLIDATIVRALLVPALMRLLGDWNWWAPAPLRRLYLRYGLSEA